MTRKSVAPLSDDQKREVLATIAAGLTIASAARTIGWTSDLLQSAILADSDLAEKIHKAEEQAEMYFVMRVRKAAKNPNSWRAGAWWLERRKPNTYGIAKPGIITQKETEEFIEKVYAVLERNIANQKLLAKILNELEKLLPTDS